MTDKNTFTVRTYTTAENEKTRVQVVLLWRIVENLYFCEFLFTVVNNNHGDSPSPQDPWKRTCEIYSFRKTI